MDSSPCGRPSMPPPRARAFRLTAPPVVGGVLLGMGQVSLNGWAVRERLIETTKSLLNSSVAAAPRAFFKNPLGRLATVLVSWLPTSHRTLELVGDPAQHNCGLARLGVIQKTKKSTLTRNQTSAIITAHSGTSAVTNNRHIKEVRHNSIWLV